MSNADKGGPVYLPKLYNGKNKTFFHFAYSGFRFRGGIRTTLTTFPTASMKNGNFSELLDAKGNAITWAVEWGAGAQLGSKGVQRDTLRPGDHVIVIGAPGRNPEDHRLRMVNITRPADNWKWGGTFD